MTPVPAPLTIRTPAFLLDQVVVTCLVVPPVLGLASSSGPLSRQENLDNWSSSR
ncbi:hypothetical protein ACFQH2_13750 [Natronoarchaeum sp. GCM10025703]|uniref:hypothetical protein n=1 Tax=Natronoarchaeum sp. GCM10025703 TaxID=3252685 RepID=UPI00361170C8